MESGAGAFVFLGLPAEGKVVPSIKDRELCPFERRSAFTRFPRLDEGGKRHGRKRRREEALKLAALAAACLFACATGHAQQAAPDNSKRVDHDTVGKASKDDIAKESENPIGNLTVLPLENYTNFGVGPHHGTLNLLEFEPVVPIHLTPD